MNIKSLAMIVFAGFLAMASIAGMSTANADDGFGTMDSADQAMAGDQATNDQATNDSMMQADNSSVQNRNLGGDATSAMNNSPSSENVGGSTDTGGPDTATGDDDY